MSLFPVLISPAYAQAATGGIAGSLGTLTQFAPLILIFAVFYFLLIRPQQQRQKDLKRTLGDLKRGDRVVTAGGILALVTRVTKESNEIEVEIAQNVRVTVLRETITNVIKPKAANDAKAVAKE
ncbi:MAG TPA: preprotein translocase subunit YajC [Acetobacteraceae bacterium]|nr:preprotein translocase subunit YajC [Acetobacteraceae bacterium]